MQCAVPLSRRRSAMVLKSRAKRLVSQIALTLALEPEAGPQAVQGAGAKGGAAISSQVCIAAIAEVQCSAADVRYRCDSGLTAQALHPGRELS